MEFFDSHSHYNDEKFNTDRDNIIKEVFEEGITRIVCAGYNVESSKLAIQLAEKYSFIYATCGISPNDMPEGTGLPREPSLLADLSPLAEHPKVVAVGEIGLDYYWNKENKELQKELFIKQIELANNLNKPIVIHSRDAVSDTIDILKNKIKAKQGGVFHCCPLNVELVKEAVKLGFYISFSGNITFKTAKPENVILEVPNDKILIETDCPYLAPQAVRGKRNNSKYVKMVAQKIADIKQMEIEEVAEITYKNAEKMFNIINN